MTLQHSLRPVTTGCVYPPETSKSNHVVIVWSELPDYDIHGQIDESMGCSLETVLDALVHRLGILEQYEEDETVSASYRQIAKDHLTAAKEALQKSWSKEDEDTSEEDYTDSEGNPIPKSGNESLSLQKPRGGKRRQAR